ncbi:MAG: sulfotransferase domain-containing protein, partial [Pseudomonadota bacterium]
RTWIYDSRRWAHYTPRPNDIVIATMPKSGTTWMQRIVGMLVFQSAEPMPMMQISAWIDQRFDEPIETVIERIEGQNHRRFLKSHVPYDGLPIYDNVKYIHIARDGRDVLMSWHHQHAGISPDIVDIYNKIGLEDELLGRKYPEWLADPADYFHRWLTEAIVPGHEDGLPNPSYFKSEQIWWQARHQLNVLLVHYNDLKNDLATEISRIAEFLKISVPASLMPELIEAATFGNMRRDGDALMGERMASIFRHGSQGFFYKGSNQRWVGLFRDEDLDLYQQKLAQLGDPALAHWLQHGGPVR